MNISLHVNGEDRSVEVDERTTLLDALRERMGLYGTKLGCGHGQCGVCTVLIDGRRVVPCLTFAWMAQGHDIVTIEGLARDGALHPIQASFVEADGLQCGYCTPGQIMSAVGLMGEGRPRDRRGIREEMSGNLCRCGAYEAIVDAVQNAGASG